MANLLEHPRAALFRAPAQEAETARDAQPGWAALPLSGRLRVLRGLRHRIAARAPELAAAAGAAQAPGKGRPEAEVLSAEILPLADACLFLEREAPRLLAPRRLGRAGRPSWLGRVTAEVRREPLGLVLILAPSNYPLFLPGVQALQALAAGNAVLWKPSPGGVQAARALVGLLVEAGLDERLVRVLPAGDDSGRAALTIGPDKVLLTGSAATGRAVLRDLADRLIPATMELSGCDALFVLPGADLERVARAVRFGLTLNQGATCIAPRRLFVPRGLVRNLEELLADTLADAPPVRLEEENAAHIRSLVCGALARGARLLDSSMESFGDPEVFRPLVVLDATPDLPLLREDLFAPVLSVVPVASTDEALDFDARCPYALGASVFGPEQAARALAARIRAGVVTVNDLIVPTADPRLSFGGQGESGFGVTRGAEGLLELTRVKTVAVRHGRWLPHLEPRTAEDGEILRHLLALGHAAHWRDRLAAVASLVRAAARSRRSRTSQATHPSREEES